jgi:hypothetical protein
VEVGQQLEDNLSKEETLENQTTLRKETIRKVELHELGASY